ncbi:hypothetical protein ACLMJK_002211 [Lecanora helva]
MTGSRIVRLEPSLRAPKADEYAIPLARQEVIGNQAPSSTSGLRSPLLPSNYTGYADPEFLHLGAQFDIERSISVNNASIEDIVNSPLRVTDLHAISESLCFSSGSSTSLEVINPTIQAVRPNSTQLLQRNGPDTSTFGIHQYLPRLSQGRPQDTPAFVGDKQPPGIALLNGSLPQSNWTLPWTPTAAPPTDLKASNLVYHQVELQPSAIAVQSSFPAAFGGYVHFSHPGDWVSNTELISPTSRRPPSTSTHSTQSSDLPSDDIPFPNFILSQTSVQTTADPTNCPHCPSVFHGTATNRKRNLRRHMLGKHSIDTRLRCPVPTCSQTFGPGRFDNRKRHIEKKHGHTS